VKDGSTGVTTGNSMRNINGNPGPRPEEPAVGGPASSKAGRGLIVGARAVSTGRTSAGLAAAIESPVAPASATPPWWKTGLVWLSAAYLLDRSPQYTI
jgi:hypothetical protein